MAEQSLDTRIASLEQASEKHEERITTHGKEIDAIREKLVRDEVENNHRDEAQRRIESKLDGLGGKVDSIIMKPVGRWDDIKGTAIGAIVTAVVMFLLARVGIV